MNESSIGKLGEALAKAQSQIKAAEKDGVNPHFKSRYSSLGAIWAACREALAVNGLAVIQLPTNDGERVGITTTLVHASGEHVSSTFLVIPQAPTPQAYGSALTYCRRYGLAAMVGVVSDDDDDASPITPAMRGRWDALVARAREVGATGDFDIGSNETQESLIARAEKIKAAIRAASPPGVPQSVHSPRTPL